MATRKDLIDALSPQYPVERVEKAIDEMIKKEGVDPNNLPTEFEDRMLESFVIIEDQKALPSTDENTNNSQMIVAQPTIASIQKAENLGISEEMLNLTALVVLGESQQEIDALMDLRDSLVKETIQSRNNQLMESLIGGFSGKATTKERLREILEEQGVIKTSEQNQQKDNDFWHTLAQANQRLETNRNKQQEQQKKADKTEADSLDSQEKKEKEMLEKFLKNLPPIN